MHFHVFIHWALRPENSQLSRSFHLGTGKFLERKIENGSEGRFSRESQLDLGFNRLNNSRTSQDGIMALGGLWYFYSIMTHGVVNDQSLQYRYNAVSAGTKEDVDRSGKNRC